MVRISRSSVVIPIFFTYVLLGVLALGHTDYSEQD